MVAVAVKVPLPGNVVTWIEEQEFCTVTKMKPTALSTILVVFVCFTSSSMAQYFNGYPCTVDCSGHEAGYEWAEENEIQDESDCDGTSNSFIEGCQSYVEEQEENSQNIWDDGAEIEEWDDTEIEESEW